MSILNSLAQTESGGNYAARNTEVGSSGRSGHFGRLQFGHDRLDDAVRAGVLPQGITPEQFMASPELQAKTEQWHKADLAQQAQRLGLTQYIGQEVGGIPITMDAIIAMGHLGGMGGARRFLTSGGRDNPADSFGTSLGDYARRHGGASAAASPVAPAASNKEQAAPRPAADTRMNHLAAVAQHMPVINALDASQFQSRPVQRNALMGFGNNAFVR